MKARKKPPGMKNKIREERKREERIGLALFVAILLTIILVSGFLVNSMLNQPSTSQPVSSSSEPKAAIIDQLSLTYPNQTFIETATNTLKQAGYTVYYYPGEKVTVEFYRNLPTHGYSLIVLRVHSSAAWVGGREGPVTLFTSERASQTKYVYEQLTDQLLWASFSEEERQKGIEYFGITPLFVSQAMKNSFQNSAIIMMGCEGLFNSLMAKAFLEKGSKVYISWNESVLATHTDQATTHLLQHFLTEKQTIKEAVTETNKELGPDPVYNSLLTYYPSEAWSYTIQNIVGTQVSASTAVEIIYKKFSETRFKEIV